MWVPHGNTVSKLISRVRSGPNFYYKPEHGEILTLLVHFRIKVYRDIKDVSRS